MSDKSRRYKLDYELGMVTVMEPGVPLNSVAGAVLMVSDHPWFRPGLMEPMAPGRYRFSIDLLATSEGLVLITGMENARIEPEPAVPEPDVPVPPK